MSVFGFNERRDAERLRDIARVQRNDRRMEHVGKYHANSWLFKTDAIIPKISPGDIPGLGFGTPHYIKDDGSLAEWTTSDGATVQRNIYNVSVHDIPAGFVPAIMVGDIAIAVGMPNICVTIASECASVICDIVKGPECDLCTWICLNCPQFAEPDGGCEPIPEYDFCCFESYPAPAYGCGWNNTDPEISGNTFRNAVYTNPVHGTFSQISPSPAPIVSNSCAFSIEFESIGFVNFFADPNGPWRTNSAPNGSQYAGTGNCSGSVTLDILEPPVGEEGATITFDVVGGSCSYASALAETDGQVLTVPIDYGEAGPLAKFVADNHEWFQRCGCVKEVLAVMKRWTPGEVTEKQIENVARTIRNKNPRLAIETIAAAIRNVFE